MNFLEVVGPIAVLLLLAVLRLLNPQLLPKGGPWFAWHPVETGALGTGGTVWLRTVWRVPHPWATVYQYPIDPIWAALGVEHDADRKDLVAFLANRGTTSAAVLSKWRARIRSDRETLQREFGDDLGRAMSL